MQLTPRHIAIIAHEANRLYCQLIGDDSQPSWDNAPEWQQSSILKGVMALKLNPNLTPEDQHNAWMADKRQAGWTYGDEKDADLKTHPCMVPYGELPQEQQLKDLIFQTVVKACLDGRLNDAFIEASRAAEKQAEVK